MSEQINYYEKELETNLNKLKEISNEVTSNLTNSQENSVNSDTFDKAFDLIEKTEKIHKQLKLETSLNNELAEKYKIILNDYSNLINFYKKSFKKSKEKLISEKNNTLLFEGGQNNGGLIQNEEYAYAGSQKLQEARRVLAGTEDTANKIMSSMEEQTNQMKSVNVKIHSMNDNLDSSNSLLNNMQNLLKKNKRIIIGFGIALSLILIIIISLKIIFK